MQHIAAHMIKNSTAYFLYAPLKARTSASRVVMRIAPRQQWHLRVPGIGFGRYRPRFSPYYEYFMSPRGFRTDVDIDQHDFSGVGAPSGWYGILLS
jgi:hypothetical protein